MKRQGDILLVATTFDGESQDSVSPEDGRYILARGEATGHYHSVDASEAAMFICPNSSILYLEVKVDTLVTHQEHDAINLRAGTYEVRQQVEYTPERVVNVVD